MRAARRPRMVVAAVLAAMLGMLVATAAGANGGYRGGYPGYGYARPPVVVPGYARGYWGPRYNVGVYVGPGFWSLPFPYAYPAYPWYAPYPNYTPYPYYPPVVSVPSSPPTYIERSTPEPSPEPSQAASWYFCRDANGYYPYVRQCPGGWERVAPLPPPPER